MRLFSDASRLVSDRFLRRAFVLAEEHRGRTSPNPMVGCVLVAGGEIVGEGAHVRAGEPHAEAVALACAGERARGACAYVTLEPCNHAGRTPPCAPALVEAGVEAVVIGMADPNPSVAGSGAEVLRAAGIRVDFAEDPGPFLELNEAWTRWVTTGMPWVTAKVALTLDGRPALKRGVRARLTGPAAGEVTRRLRDAADAVLVGANTLRVDDPDLTVRDADGALSERQPLRIGIARVNTPPPDARIFSDGAGPAIALVGDWSRAEERAAFQALGVEVVTFSQADGMPGAMRVLGERGIVHVLVEPGPTLFALLWEARAIDELVVFHAGGLGGAHAVSLYAPRPTQPDTHLTREFAAVEAGLAGSDAVTRWMRGPLDEDATPDSTP